MLCIGRINVYRRRVKQRDSGQKYVLKKGGDVLKLFMPFVGYSVLEY